MTRRSQLDLDAPSIVASLENIRAEFDLAQTQRWNSRSRGVAAVGRPGDWHWRNESSWLRAIEFARGLDRQDPVIGQGISRVIDNVLGDGCQLDVKTPDEEINTELAARWEEWGCDPRACDAQADGNVHDLAASCLRGTIVDGDHFALATTEGQLQLREAHHCRTPSNTTQNVVFGVKIDTDRRPLEYWFTQDELSPLSPLVKVADVARLPAWDEDGCPVVFHIKERRRITYTRGVSAMAPIGNMSAMHDDLQLAALVKAVVSMSWVILEQSVGGGSGIPTGGKAEVPGQTTIESLPGGSSRLMENVSPGMRVSAPNGKQLTGFSPNVPNAEFFSHSKLLLTLMAINLGLPLCVFLLDCSETNFSGFRGAMDQARMGFRRLQRMLVQRYYKPTYCWKLRQWLATDAALRNAAQRLGNQFFHHEWTPPAFPYLEPLTDAQADAFAVRTGLTSPRRMHAARGRDHTKIVNETIADNTFAINSAIEAALSINSKYGAKLDRPVDWREIIALPMPEGLQLQLVNQPQSQPQPVGPAKK